MRAIPGCSGAHRERGGAGAHPQTGEGVPQGWCWGKAAERPGAAGTQDRQLGRYLGVFSQIFYVYGPALKTVNPTLIEKFIGTYNILLSDNCCLYVAVRMVDAVGLSRLPHASGGLHEPWGCPASHALPGPTRTDEVRNQNPFCKTSHTNKAVYLTVRRST